MRYPLADGVSPLAAWLRRSLRRVAQPMSLVGRPAGVAVAAACCLSLALISLADLVLPHTMTVGSFEVIPVLVAGWLLSRRATLVVGIWAMLCRLAPVALGGVDPITASGQVAVVPFLAVVSQVAATSYTAARASFARESLVSRIAYIASSAASLETILDRILKEMARDGLRGGTIALIDERSQLYLAAAQGDIDSVVRRSRLPVGQGIMGRVAATGEAALVRDLDRPGAPTSPVRHLGSNTRMRSLVAVPIRAAGTVIGVLELDSDRPDRFSESDLVVMEQVAAAIAGAVQRSGALQLADQALQRRVRELAILLDVARRLGASLELDVILREVCRSAAEITLSTSPGRRRASVIRLQADHVAVLADYDEEGLSLRGRRFPFPVAIDLERATRLGAGATAPPQLAEQLRAAVAEAGVSSGAQAPIRVGNELFGMLLVWAREEHSFDAAELRLLQGVADLTGLAIGNAESLRLERSRSDQLRDHAERMAELDKAKSEFLRLASHELRGPLAILRGYLSMLEEGSLGELPEAALGVIPTMSVKLRQMNLLIEQMLETARLEDSKLQLAVAPVDLREVVRGAVESMDQPRSELERVRIEVPDEEVSVVVDAPRIATIVANLLDNALKYSPGGGDVRCRLTADGGLARLSVSDRGLGIDPEHVGALFTRFGRIVTAENSHIPGTGLGLYLSRELALMHGGEIRVQSEGGRGSTFTLELPLASGDLPAAAPPPEGARPVASAGG